MEVEAIKIISVFGAGTMGHGIAQIMAQQGYKVLLGDVRQELLDAALDRVKRSLQKLVEKGKISQGECQRLLCSPWSSFRRYRG